LFSWFGLSILCLALSCSSSKATDEQDSTDTIVLDVEDTDISKDASDSTIAKPDTPSPSDAQNDDTNLVEDAQDASPPDPDGAVDTNPPDVCQPDCTGKSCGGDGCGGNCGTCGDDETCEAGLCADVAQPPLTGCESNTWPSNLAHAGNNPLLTPKSSCNSHGADNIYAPDILRVGDQYFMWYGGQGQDGHDRIFLATSANLIHWQHHPASGCPQAVVDVGGSSHVNDPSVVKHGGTFYMFFTDAQVGIDDKIALATSPDGVQWTKHGIVLDDGAPGQWDSGKVGRPAVLHEEGEFRMWYDGAKPGAGRHVGYATSPDGFNWTRYAGNPIIQNAGAIDVDRVGTEYILLAEGGDATHRYNAPDPVSWSYQGKTLTLSGQPYDQFGQVTPFLYVEDCQLIGVFYGGASDACWCKNRIAAAWPNGEGPDPGTPPAGDCSNCLVGFNTCTAACQAAGKASGTCANPGSTDPSACCACEEKTAPPPDCSGCWPSGFTSCDAACKALGYKTGICAVPGSQDDSNCCACLNKDS
jgi:hypothetical protein